MTPCARPACPQEAKVKYCSRRCAIRHRVESGYRVKTTAATWSAAGKIGGKRSGAKRRRACRQRLIAELSGRLVSIQRTMTHRQWLRVLAMVLRFEKQGYQRGNSARLQATWRQRKKAA